MSLKVKKLTQLGKNDYSKIIFEVLRSLKVEIVDDDTADFDELEIFNEITGRRITTRLKVNICGEEYFFKKSSLANENERFGAEINRLIKKNLYLLLVGEFGLKTVPYGILHGVRPTKIIQRWIDKGFGVTSQGIIDKDRISRRICADFLTEREKANLLTEISIKQLPVIRSSDEKTVNVYVGIPFCKTRCLYCSFPSFILPNEEKISEFMSVLTRDIDSVAEKIKDYGLKVQTIYIGGGTPSALPEKFFAEMLEKVYNSFYGEKTVEFTVECGRPDTITAEKISAMKKFRVNRVSVNPQTMNQETLDKIGRKHTVEDVKRAFNELRAEKNWKINMDLIIGLPGEGFFDFKNTLEQILALSPDDITIHSLAIKRGSKIQMLLADEMRKIEDFDLPSDEEVRKMSEYATKTLRGAKFSPYYLYRQGYMSGQIENVGWSRFGAEGIYNIQIMSERQIILGVGSAASTKIPDKNAKKILTAFNAKDLTTYLRDIDKYIERRKEILSLIAEGGEI